MVLVANAFDDGARFSRVERRQRQRVDTEALAQRL